MKTIKEGFLRKNLGLGREELIKTWLDKHKIINYTINKDLTIDIKGNVNLERYKEEQLPNYIQFRIVTGRFNIRLSDITSLRGCPKEVGHYFSCMACPKLKSLEGCPQKVEYHFDCSECNSLESLKDCPKEIGGSLYCYNCLELKSLGDCPVEVGEDFYCSGCPKLKSLEGCSQKVGGNFECSGCSKLESLENCPKEVGGDFYCECCGIQFTENDIKKICKVKGKILT